MTPNEPDAAEAADAQADSIDDLLTRAEIGDKCVLPSLEEALK